MSGRVESGVLNEGDSAGVPRESFENHFRDMFLNVTRGSRGLMDSESDL